MKILVCGSAEQQEEIRRNLPEKDDVIFCEDYREVIGEETFGAFFMLNGEMADATRIEASCPVFLNAVAPTLREMNAPENVIRINGWPGFLERSVWEVAGTITSEAHAAAAAIGKKLVTVKDVPGLISATVVSMIINEAFYALKEGLSTREEIDLAMKAATNYPRGPFEWGEMIGRDNIHHLLRRLSMDDVRYNISFTPDQTI